MRDAFWEKTTPFHDVNRPFGMSEGVLLRVESRCASTVMREWRKPLIENEILVMLWGDDQRVCL